MLKLASFDNRGVELDFNKSWKGELDLFLVVRQRLVLTFAFWASSHMDIQGTC
jgi:hypothetical protein